MSIRENIEIIRTRIAAACERAGRQAHDVTLMAVTKTVGVDSIQEALDAGIVHFGENRVHDAIPKINTFQARQDLTWYMIGHVQTNKVKRAVEYFQKIHSIDSLKLAREVHKRAEQQGRLIEILFEVNVSGEESKFGLAPEDLAAVVREATQLDSIMVKGLMTMAPFVDDPEETRPYFRRLRTLLTEFQDQGFSHITDLSMGMTNDFEVAVEEGATIVRVGSAIFGTR